jgi:F-type H+-transporting ATPase subunit b
MTALFAWAAAAEEGQVAQIARTFGVNWSMFGAQVVSFAIVCALLYRFAYRPVLAMLAARREQIALGLAHAEQIKAELARTEAQRQSVLAEANAQATRLIEEARAVMGRLQREEARKAVANAEQIVANAREAAARDHARMLSELKGEVGRLVVHTTAAVTGKVLTPDDQRRLAEETVRRLAG